MKIRNNRIYVILLSIFCVAAVSCSKKPADTPKDGTFDALYLKSELIGPEFLAGDTSNQAVQNFVGALMRAEKESGFNLTQLGGSHRKLQEGDKIWFSIHKKTLFMHFAGSDDPIGKWPIGDHCNLEKEKNEKGEDTRYITTECDKYANDYSKTKWISVEAANVTPRSIKQGTDHYKRKLDLFENKGFGFTGKTGYSLKTGTYVNKNIQASRTFDEKLKKFVIRGSSLTRARELVLPPGSTLFNVLAPVEFKSNVPANIVNFNSQSLPDLEILAAENTEYALDVSLTENHLIVRKLVSEEQLATAEKTYAEVLDNGLYAVPLAGYPIKKVKYEHKIENNVKSTELTPVEVLNLADTTHIEIKENDVVKFKPIEKVDVFPASIFNDDEEWYYEKTVVNRPVDDAGTSIPRNYELGTQVEDGRMKVNLTKNSIQLVDVNVAEEIEDADGDRMRVKLEIPVEWIDYRVKQTGKDSGLEEEELIDGHQAANQWDKRNWVKIEFNRADAITEARSDSFKLTRLEIDDGYIGFDVYNSVTQITHKFSMERASESLPKGKTRFVTDKSKFGLFVQIRETLGGIAKEFEDAQERRYNIARMYPKPDPKNNDQPTIWFYITNSSPNEPYIQSATQKAIDAWNKAFAKAAENTGKTPISVKLAEERVELGDVRYNKVAYYGYDRLSRLLGYGPGVKDPRTGEVHIATNHIYLRNYRKGIWQGLRDYVLYELGHFNDKWLNAMNDFDPETKEFFSIFPEQKLSFKYGAGEGSFAEAALADSEMNGYENASEKDEEYADAACEAGYTASNANIIKDVQQYCDFPGSKLQFKDYIDDLKARAEKGEYVTHDIDTMEAAFTSCSDILLEKKMIATLVHEFGHNFGLRHNFAASSDIDNFPKRADGSYSVLTSSVMDYAGPDDDRGLEPGPYDIASIRYAYYDTVEAIPSIKQPGDIQYVQLNDRSIDEAIAQDAPGRMFKPYKFCTDYHIDTYGSAQIPEVLPECQKWDRGTSAVERVQHYIDGFQAYYMTNGYRFDRDKMPSSLEYFAGYHMDKYIYPLKLHYDHFRFLLSRQTNNPYLQDFDNVKMETFVANSGDANLQDYYDASRLVIRFLKTLAFSPAGYCYIANQASGLEKFFDYERLRETINTEHYMEFGQILKIDSCDDSDAIAYMENKVGFKADTVKFVGNIYGNVPWSPAPEENFDRPEIQYGLERAREAAMYALTNRKYVSYYDGKYLPTPAGGSKSDERAKYKYTSKLFAAEGFRPSILDEEQVRYELMAQLVDRLILGENKPYLLESGKDYSEFDTSKTTDPTYFFDNAIRDTHHLPFFDRESSFYKLAYAEFLYGMEAPGVSTDRSFPWESTKIKSDSFKTWAESKLPKGVDPTTTNLKKEGWKYATSGSYYFLAHPNTNPFAYLLINRYGELSSVIKKVAAMDYIDEPLRNEFLNILAPQIIDEWKAVLANAHTPAIDSETSDSTDSEETEEAAPQVDFQALWSDMMASTVSEDDQVRFKGAIAILEGLVVKDSSIDINTGDVLESLNLELTDALENYILYKDSIEELREQRSMLFSIIVNNAN